MVLYLSLVALGESQTQEKETVTVFLRDLKDEDECEAKEYPIAMLTSDLRPQQELKLVLPRKFRVRHNRISGPVIFYGKESKPGKPVKANDDDHPKKKGVPAPVKAKMTQQVRNDDESSYYVPGSSGSTDKEEEIAKSYRSVEQGAASVPLSKQVEQFKASDNDSTYNPGSGDVDDSSDDDDSTYNPGSGDDDDSSDDDDSTYNPGSSDEDGSTDEEERIAEAYRSLRKITVTGTADIPAPLRTFESLRDHIQSAILDQWVAYRKWRL